MADPIIACPDFAQKALEKSEQLERSLDRSPRSSQAGAVCKKTAPPSSGSAWVPMARNALIVAAALTSCDAFGKIRVPPGAPWVTRQWTSPPKQQVGDGVQAATSNTRISPPAFEAPILRPALPDAAEAPPPPKAVLLSQTEINDLSECLKEEGAEGSGLRFSSSPSTRDLLTGRHRVGPGRRLISWFDCRKVIHKFNMICFVGLVMYASAAMAQGILSACFTCGSKVKGLYDVRNVCDVYQYGVFGKGTSSYFQTDCPASGQMFQVGHKWSKAYYSLDMEYAFINARGFFERATKDSVPPCYSAPSYSAPVKVGDLNCKLLNNAAYKVGRSLLLFAMAFLASISAMEQG
eukprot:GHVT01024877.1.p1 GENE.GHVT01024877.1~~GHVT01024877.1.p1  ORF type:complete len:368 (+),score=41.87 GHVT01024877.1:57-1106(+)